MEKLPNKKTWEIPVEMTNIRYHRSVGIYKQRRISSVSEGTVISPAGGKNRASIYEMPTLGQVHCMLLHLTFTITLKGAIIIPVLQMKNLRLKS